MTKYFQNMTLAATALIVALGLAGLAASTDIVARAEDSTTAAAIAPTGRQIDLAIMARRLVGQLELSGGVPVIRLHLGEPATLNWLTSEGTELHLHGYDIDLELAPGEIGRMVVPANFAGRFALEAHSFAGTGDAETGGHHDEEDAEERAEAAGETVLLYIEVLP